MHPILEKLSDFIKQQKGKRMKLTPQQLENAERQVEAFLGDGAWHTWREIKTALGIPREWVRRMDLYNGGHIIGNAQEGIKLTALAEDDEITHTLRAMNSHANEMLARADAIAANAR
jgi:hypothetical protein